MTLEQKLQQLHLFTMYCWGEEFMLAIEVINDLINERNDLLTKLEEKK